MLCFSSSVRKCTGPPPLPGPGICSSFPIVKHRLPQSLSGAIIITIITSSQKHQPESTALASLRLNAADAKLCLCSACQSLSTGYRRASPAGAFANIYKIPLGLKFSNITEHPSSCAALIASGVRIVHVTLCILGDLKARLRQDMFLSANLNATKSGSTLLR